LALFCLCFLLPGGNDLPESSAPLKKAAEGLTSYDLILRLDDGEDTLAISQTVDFRNDTGDTLSTLVLRTWLNAYQEEESSPAPVKNGLPLVCVYCTHAGEEYKGQTRVNGQPGGVMQAAAALVSALEERGVGVIFDETLHDSPSYDEAYGSSLRSISAIREENPSVELYIDVHRDSPIEGLSTRLETEEGAYARMMFIIGTNEKLEHPFWQQNHSFALELDAALNELLPGVTREPRVYSGRYNQHISPEAILVEVGSTENSVEEAERSAALLAEAICAVKGW